MSNVRPIDRALVRLYTGPIGRGTSFAIELATALIRGLRGRAHPEDGSRR